MAELKAMKNSVMIGAAGLLAFGLVAFSGAPGAAAPPEQSTLKVAGQPTDLSAQARRRARTRIEVRPIRRQPAAWDYPRPGDVSWPGPGALRDCVFRLEQEYRPSGTVIVPRQSCWWVRG
jgi:hypothetical protein